MTKSEKNNCAFENLKRGILCKLAEQHEYHIFKFARCVLDEKSQTHGQNLAFPLENLQ